MCTYYANPHLLNCVILKIRRYKFAKGRMLNFTNLGTSLVVQWLRLHAPMQGSWVQPLVEELDPTCCAMGPKH